MKFMGETYEGRALPRDLDFSRTALVLVTGDFPNTCGHVLLYVSGLTPRYYHFNGPTLLDLPRVMNGDAEYQRFLRESGKHELIRKYVTVPKPEGAKEMLYRLMNKKWATLLISHNCATFASEVLHAGGNFWEMPSHCPVIEMATEAFWEKIFGPMRVKLGTQALYEQKRLRH